MQLINSFKNFFYAFDSRNCQTIISTRETSTSKSSVVVVYCNRDIESSIVKTTITDHYTVNFHVKIICKIQSNNEKHFTFMTCKKLKESSILPKMDFNLNHDLGKILDKRYDDD